MLRDSRTTATVRQAACEIFLCESVSMESMLADFKALHEALHAENARLKSDVAQVRAEQTAGVRTAWSSIDRRSAGICRNERIYNGNVHVMRKKVILWSYDSPLGSVYMHTVPCCAPAEDLTVEIEAGRMQTYPASTSR